MAANCSATSSEDCYGRNCQYTYNDKIFLGKGAFGFVYQASITHHGDGAEIRGDVAVKRCHFSKMPDPVRDRENWVKRRARWENLIKLKHQRLLTYYKICVFQSPGGASVEYLMDYCSGGDLASLLGSSKSKEYQLDQLEALCYVTQIIDGIQYLHDKKIIHGDLKPGNILLNNVKPEKHHHSLLIGDLDDLIPMQQSISNPSDFPTVHGSFRYTSPECLKKMGSQECDNLGRKSDIWSIGCIIHDLANCCFDVPDKILVKKGSPPLFTNGLSDYVFAMRIVDGYVPETDDRIFTSFKEMIKRCLEVDSRKRPSATELMRLLLRELRELGVSQHEGAVQCSVCGMLNAQSNQSAECSEREIDINSTDDNRTEDAVDHLTPLNVTVLRESVRNVQEMPAQSPTDNATDSMARLAYRNREMFPRNGSERKWRRERGRKVEESERDRGKSRKEFQCEPGAG
ncbi:mitogen-activated protein kinase kinase kinase 19-like [Paramacrobiotus metropolitanus]|uniref:mitogen-activated protein kinase kinase kinase 19-like n=1 Tax=Paramacrobiotus metropolitanus TaxID=2943436 RepID=UPI0024463E4F|nr:mitogen-activated protein kinase kinase kinase 19-like [Paramacrobiotus metropolitanus]